MVIEKLISFIIWSLNHIGKVPMNVYILLLLSFSFMSNFYECGKIKIVDEPFSFNGAAGVGSRNDQEVPLLIKYKAEKPSGPPYLIENLNGKCFSLISSHYKYEICPFKNVTQREQTYRWNAYSGVLGIWKDWIIIEDKFAFMHMVHGDNCAGNLERETKVNFTCGDENVVLSVSEPSMCKYEMIFQTPYACPKDVFFVYPILSEHGKERWREIEKLHAINVTTKQGYEKNRKKLFIDEGLLVPEHLVKRRGENAMLNFELHSSSSTENYFPDLQHVATARFNTKEQCNVAYSNLLHEVEMLREQLATINLRKIESELVAGTKIDTVGNTIKTEKISDNSNNSSLRDEASSPDKTDETGKRIKGDLGSMEKNEIQNIEAPDTLQKLTINSNDKNTKSKQYFRKGRKNGQKGDDGIIDETSYPMRKLMFRLEYEAHLKSRFKIHSKIRDAQQKGKQ